MSKLFVHVNDVVEEMDLPAEEAARDQYAEIIVKGDGRCRMYRMEDLLPDITAMISGINSSITILAEEIDEIRCDRS